MDLPKYIPCRCCGKYGEVYQVEPIMMYCFACGISNIFLERCKKDKEEDEENSKLNSEACEQVPCEHYSQRFFHYKNKTYKINCFSGMTSIYFDGCIKNNEKVGTIEQFTLRRTYNPPNKILIKQDFSTIKEQILDFLTNIVSSNIRKISIDIKVKD